jgi:hypothetical protein
MRRDYFLDTVRLDAALEERRESVETIQSAEDE